MKLKLHFLLPLLVTFLALAFLDPLHFLMLNMSAEAFLGILVLITIIYSTLIFRENSQDEREEHIRAFSHRLAYIVSVAGLVSVLAYRILTEKHVYPEIVCLLILIVAVKTISYWYGERNM